MKLFWIVLFLLFLIPGTIEAYVAFKLMNFTKLPGTKITLQLAASNAAVDLSTALFLFLGILSGNLRLELDTSNPLAFIAVSMVVFGFLWYRLGNALHCLWLLGLVEEGILQTLPNTYLDVKSWVLSKLIKKG
jgi:hypothetical protein